MKPWQAGSSNGSGSTVQRIKVKYGAGQKYELDHEITNHFTRDRTFTKCLKGIKLDRGSSEIKGIGHRVVAGGEYFSQPVIVDNDVIAKIKRISTISTIAQSSQLKWDQSISEIFTQFFIGSRF